MSPPLPIVLHCAERLKSRVRYVLDTLLMAAGVPVAYTDQPPADGVYLAYSTRPSETSMGGRRLAIAHCEDAWAFFDRDHPFPAAPAYVQGLNLVFPKRAEGLDPSNDIDVDIIANAFYFLSSWWERVGCACTGRRQLHSDSVFVRLAMPRDIVDQYLQKLIDGLNAACERTGAPMWPRISWPGNYEYALVLSHDVDFIPYGLADNLMQGAKTVIRCLVRQRDLPDACRAVGALLKSLALGRDPYGCMPEIIAREQTMGVRSSIQVAVGRRHPSDVNYRIRDDLIRDYLQVIVDAGFDLCLHGSYLSTQNPDWYVEEVALLTERLQRPLGSRQHFLSFDYDTLFGVQQSCGIEYDMSMGYPDDVGPRCGFSYPYFPYDLRADRAFDVLQISLVLMDVTLRSYLGHRPEHAWPVIVRQLVDLRAKGGGASVVWHPIVFSGARDPGYDRLFWRMVDEVKRTGGLATDGRTVNAHWRDRARNYDSFRHAA
jgi:hypothetical protein